MSGDRQGMASDWQGQVVANWKWGWEMWIWAQIHILCEKAACVGDSSWYSGFMARTSVNCVSVTRTDCVYLSTVTWPRHNHQFAGTQLYRTCLPVCGITTVPAGCKMMDLKNISVTVSQEIAALYCGIMHHRHSYCWMTSCVVVSLCWGQWQIFHSAHTSATPLANFLLLLSGHLAILFTWTVAVLYAVCCI